LKNILQFRVPLEQYTKKTRFYPELNLEANKTHPIFVYKDEKVFNY